MAKSKKKNKQTKQVKKPRDLTILAAFKNEINLKTQVISDKTKYSKKDRRENKNIKREDY